MSIKNYQSYFRSLAIAHKVLQHNPASEDGDALPGERRFARWSVDELVSGLRTAVGFPALLLENYEVVTKEANKYDIKGSHSGAFTILDHAEPGSCKSEVAAFEKTEQIMYEILQKIWQDHYNSDTDRCETPFQNFHYDLDIQSVGPILNNEFGWRVEFSFTPKLLVDFKQPPAAGTFL